MLKEEKIKMFKEVFDPKPDEKILFLIDTPHNNIKDNDRWMDLRDMAVEWYNIFKEMGEFIGFSVDMLKYKATGMHNSPILDDVLNAVSKFNLVLAMTEFSASSSLMPLVKQKGNITRVASMPQVERRMEDTAFKAHYKDLKKYSTAIKNMLDSAVGAEILFSTGDKLFIDLRNRSGGADTGECRKIGQSINFPSGEGCIAPYEGSDDEIEEFGLSKTEGIWPVLYNGELVRYVVKNNVIVDIIGNGEKAKGMSKFFNEKKSRRNIAELGIGCNPMAVVTGNVLEDEKVGLHIAYGMSTHIGGKVDSDIHQDIVYAKGCPVEGTTLILINDDGSKIKLIENAILRYDLLK